MRRPLGILPAVLILAACLFLDTSPLRSSRVSGPAVAAILAALLDPATQWMAYACSATCLFAAMLLGRHRAQSATGSLPVRPRGGAAQRSACLLSAHGSNPGNRAGPASPPGGSTGGEPFWDWRNPDAWLCGFLVWVTLRYAVDYETASCNAQALALVSGAAIGKGVRLCLMFRNSNRGLDLSTRIGRESGDRAGLASRSQYRQLIRTAQSATSVSFASVISLVFLLAFSALWQPDSNIAYQYRGEVRWQGVWGNPNTFGLLMGVGLVLAAGLLFPGRAVRDEPAHSAADGSRWQAPRLCGSRWSDNRDNCSAIAGHLKLLVVTGAAGLCAWGLLRSYSRGAWLGVLIALACLTWRRTRSVECPDARTSSGAEGLGHPGRPGHAPEQPGDPSPPAVRLTAAAPGSVQRASLLSWLSQNRLPVVVLSLSLFVLALWQLRHSEQPLVRRVFTVFNPNDLSWRNRIAAWEGALAMTAENPLCGVGWSRTESLYNRFYKPVRIDEGMAVQLNHYFVVGMAAGLPGLVCFLGYAALCLSQIDDRGLRNGRRENANGSRVQTTGLPAVCHAGAMVLLVGLWFDGGLFHLATAAPLWTLLEFGRAAPLPPRRSSALPRISCPAWRWEGMLAVGTLLACSLVWAHARNPFRVIELTAQPEAAPKTTATVVMPAHGGPFPVAIWIRPVGDSLIPHEDELRRIAELGLAAVGFKCSQTNQGVFDAQFDAVLERVASARWAEPHAAAWLGDRSGAQRSCRFLLDNPNRQPRAIVWLKEGGNDWPEVRAQHSEPGAAPMMTRIDPRHGEDDRAFAAADGAQMNDGLGTAGFPVRLCTLSQGCHRSNEDSPVLVRSAGEFCAAALGAQERVRVNSRPGVAWAWLPACCTIGFLGWRVVRRLAIAWPPSSRVLVVCSGVTAGAAALDSALHLGIPLLPATPRTVAWANQIVVQPELRASFQWLVSQQGLHEQVPFGPYGCPDGLSVATGGRDGGESTIHNLLEHLELAALQRDLTDWVVPDDLWKEWVLSPHIEGTTGPDAWRRALWEHLHPRVRREGSAGAAAARVARQLTLRVRVVGKCDQGDNPGRAWARGECDPSGFQRLYIAALRSVGIPSRLSDDGIALFHDGTGWRPAPQISVSLRAVDGTDLFPIDGDGRR